MTGIILKVDEAGWRVPMEGSLSFRIYELSKAGKKPSEIADVLQIKVSSVRVLKWKMSHPLDSNKRTRDLLRAKSYDKRLANLQSTET